MYPVSSNFLTAVRSSGRSFKYKAIITRTGYTDLTFTENDIVSMNRTAASISSTDFEIGSVVSTQFSITLKNYSGVLVDTKFKGAIVKPSVGVLLSDGTYEYCNLGVFYVEETSSSEGSITLSCYDGMIKLESLYISDISYPATLLQIAQEISSKSGISLAYTGFPNSSLSVPTKPDLAGTTLRQALAWVAEAACSFARINRNGLLEFAWYSATGEKINRDNSSSLQLLSYVVPDAYDGVRILVSSDDTSPTVMGTCSNPYDVVANPLLVENQNAALTAIYNRLNGFSYMPFESKWTGNPALDQGDIITITDRDGTDYSSAVTNDAQNYTGGLQSTTNSEGFTDNPTSTNGTLSARVDKVTSDQQEITNLMTTNFSAVNASIENLRVSKADINYLQANYITADAIAANYAAIKDVQATYATIDNLNAATADIQSLQADKLNADTAAITYATINSLTAANGNIANLQSDNATIINLLSDNAGIGSLSSDSVKAAYAALANAQLGDAQIANLSAGKITSGIINTSNVSISSASGYFALRDNTMQISDASRVRVQIGKDAAGDYSMYVWDASGNLMFDAAGLHAAAIKSGIIRNDMVASDAEIDGGKIDQESLITRINGATTLLESSHVKYDPTGQTLETAFSNLSSTVTAQGSTLTTQGTSISTMQGQFSSKIWTTDITSAMSGLAGSGRNVVLNSTFDSSKSNWSDFSNGGTNTIVTGYNGHNAVEISRAGASSGSGRQGISQTCSIAIHAGETYTISAWVYVKTGFDADNNQIFLRTADFGDVPCIAIPASTATGKWIHLTNSHTFSQDTGAHLIYVLVGVNGTVDVSQIKLEQGTVATGWSPAPEDTATAISTNSSAITQLNNQIALKVGTSTYNSDVGNLQTRMTSAESEISLQAGQINLKVSQSDIDTSIGKLAGIGTNLLLETAFDADFKHWTYGPNTSVTTNFYMGHNAFTTVAPSGSNYVDLKQQISNISPNAAYTFSFYGCGNLVIYFVEQKTDDTSTANYRDNCHIYGFQSFDTPTKEQFTFTTQSDTAKLIFYFRVFQGASGRIVMPKLESGIIASGWSPAPEDTTTAIDSAQTTAESYTDSQVTILKNSIDLKVSAADFSSYQSSVSGQFSTTNGNVTTAQNAANSANTAATTAQTTANNAATAASAAQTTANAKAKVFTSQPTPPYSVGDLWANAAGDLLQCTNAEASGSSYSASDWSPASAVTNARITTAEQKITSDAIVSTVTSSSSWSGMTNSVSAAQSTADGAQGTAESASSQANIAWTHADNAQATADGKAKVFTSQPVPPYSVGDLWTNASGDLMQCTKAEASGSSYSASDWTYASAITNARINTAEQKITPTAITSTVASNIAGNTLTSIINQSATTVAISATKIQLTGTTTLSSWANASDQTKIDGSKIYTGSISADKIDVTNLSVYKLIAQGNANNYAIMGSGNDSTFSLYNAYSAKNFMTISVAGTDYSRAVINTLLDNGLTLSAGDINAANYQYINIQPYSWTIFSYGCWNMSSPGGTVITTNGDVDFNGNMSSTNAYVTSGIQCGGKMQLYGTGYPQVFGDGSNLFLNLANEVASGNGLVISGGTVRPNGDNKVNCGLSNHRWAVVYAATGTINTSDRNDKNSICRISAEQANNFIMALNPVTFKFNDGTSGRTHWGLIAQDVEDEMNALGITSKDFAGFIKTPQDDGSFIYGLRYSEFISPMIATIQQQALRITELEGRISALEGRMNQIYCTA